MPDPAAAKLSRPTMIDIASYMIVAVMRSLNTGMFNVSTDRTKLATFQGNRINCKVPNNCPARMRLGRFKVTASIPTPGIILGGSIIASTALLRQMKTLIPKVCCPPTKWNQAILALCPSLASPYKLPFYLSNGHVETIFAALFRKKPHINYSRELLRMPDGGTVALDAEDTEEHALPNDAPVLILLPGLTGGSEDSYVQHAVIHAREAGIRAVVFNGRGTSDSPVTTAQYYSASYTDDLRAVITHVATTYPSSSMFFAAGWSLGANILTRYLGEEGAATPLTAAAALCNPFNLPISNRNFQKGFNKVYSLNLGKSLNKIYRKHAHMFEEAAAKGEKAYDTELALRARTIKEFDEAITRISFNWPSVEAYYEGSSSSLVVHKVAIPLLVVQAADDPIAPEEAIPYRELHDNPNCILVVTPTGGHLGWCSGNDGVTGAPWTDKAMQEYFIAVRQLVGQFGIERPHAEQDLTVPAGLTRHQAP